MKTFLLKTSFVFLLFFCIHIQDTEAQIIYTDVIPDSVFSAANGNLSIDLNKDGIIDFKLTTNSKTTPSCSTLGTRTNKYLKVTPADTNNAILNISNLPAALAINTLIDSSSQFWKNTASQKMGADTFRCSAGGIGGGRPRPTTWVNAGSGNFRNTTDKYLAVRFYAGKQLYYGWIRFSITTNLTVTLKDFAYQSSGKSILTGQTSDDYQYIVISASKVSKLCVGDSIKVDYLIFGKFDLANVVSVELSDSVGKFNNGTIIGSYTRNSSGTIPCKIPPSFSGTGFRFRIISSNPAQISSDNGSNLIINSKLPNTLVTPNQAQVVCDGSSVALTAPLGNGNTYQWKKDSVNLPGSVIRNYSANTSGLYSCDISNACGTAHSNVVSLNVIKLPALNIIPKDPVTIVLGDSVVLSSSFVDTSLIYHWYRNSIFLNPVASAMTYTAKLAGTYVLKIIHKEYGCTSTSPDMFLRVLNASAVPEINSAPLYLKVQPNPFSNAVLISFLIQDKQKFSVSIVDLTGRQVKTIASDVSAGGNFEYNWLADDQNGNPMNSGIYFLKLDAETFSQTKKLILVR
jgi:hypothetical protein